MPAALASCSTVSQPVSTTGENAITSTFCAMNVRSALIWFSCFCCASAKRRSMFMVAAADLMDSVFAVRHSLSAPIWLKPSTMRSSFFSRAQLASSSAARRNGQNVPDVKFSSYSPSGFPSEHGRVVQREAARLDQQLVDRAARPSAGRSISNSSPACDPDVVDEAHGRGAEEMQMHVARHAMLPVLEVVVLEVGEGVAHVRLRR